MRVYNLVTISNQNDTNTFLSAPSAIFIAGMSGIPPHGLLFLIPPVTVIGTGLIGWILNIVLVLCSGPLENLPGSSGSAFLEVCLVSNDMYTGIENHIRFL